MVNTLKTKQIPLLDLKAQYSSIQQEIEDAVIEVLRSGHYVLGPNVQAFEQESAELLAAKHAISCANGTDALILALRALDIGPEDEVLTTPFTFMATAATVALSGAKPVFTDIDINTFNIDVKQIEKYITNKTKAIIAVHLYGQACDMDGIMAIALKHNLKVIEDTAQAFGTKYKNQSVGTIGDIGTYSFYPTKNISAAGDAGMVSTNDDELAARLKRIRVHGSNRRYYHDELGFNSRLDEIQAAILRIKLKHINDWNARRAKLAGIYNQKLSGKEFQGCQIITPQCISESTHSYHQYTIQLDKSNASLEKLETIRNNLQLKLRDNNISSEVYYPLPLHMQKSLAYLNYKAEDFPNSLKASNSILCLPIYPELSEEDINFVISKILS